MTNWFSSRSATTNQRYRNCQQQLERLLRLFRQNQDAFEDANARRRSLKALVGLAMARRAMGDPAAAIRAFEGALATPPPASVAWGLEEQLALLHAAQGDTGRARQYAQDALHKAPEKDKAPLEARLRAAGLL